MEFESEFLSVCIILYIYSPTRGTLIIYDVI